MVNSLLLQPLSQEGQGLLPFLSSEQLKITSLNLNRFGDFKFIQMKKFNFIYKTTNLINNRVYIGKHSTDNLDDNYLGSGKLIKQAINKYGRDNFKREILEFCNNEEGLNKKEVKLIMEQNSTKRSFGYNIANGGEGTLGLVHSEETKLGFSLNRMGDKNPNFNNKMSDSSKNRISVANTGRKVSKEMRRKLSISNIGKIRSEESKEKYRKANLGDKNPMFGKKPWNEGMEIYIGEENPFFGRVHTLESLNKMRYSHSKRKRVTCLHCNKTLDISNATRWHNENCKFKL